MKIERTGDRIEAVSDSKIVVGQTLENLDLRVTERNVSVLIPLQYIKHYWQAEDAMRGVPFDQTLNIESGSMEDSDEVYSLLKGMEVLIPEEKEQSSSEKISGYELDRLGLATTALQITRGRVKKMEAQLSKMAMPRDTAIEMELRQGKGLGGREGMIVQFFLPHLSDTKHWEDFFGKELKTVVSDALDNALADAHYKVNKAEESVLANARGLVTNYGKKLRSAFEESNG